MREMRDSGIKWLGQFPSRWELLRAKNFFQLTNERGNDELVLLAATQRFGMFPQHLLEGVVRVKEDTDLSTFRTVHKNDFVISLRSFQGGFEMSELEGVCSPAYQTFCAKQAVVHRYYKYLFKCGGFVDYLNSLTQGIREGKTIKYEDFAVCLIPKPPLDEQQRIVDYLDIKCAEIDRAIETAEKSIEELLKYRSSYLEDTFSRLDSIYPKVKLKYVLEESKEKSVDGIGEPLSITIASGVLRSSELEIPNPASSMIGAKVVHAGDLVFNKLKAYLGVMYVSSYDGLISSEYAIYRALNPSDVSLKYIEYLVHTNRIIDEFIIRISGVADGFRRLYTSELFNIAITLPPLLVQEKAVRELNTIYDSIDTSIAAKRAIIADLKAYKQSLIYEVVTGKREV